MSSSSSSKLLPRQIDPRKFAQQGITLTGSLPLTALPRLCELLVDEDDGEVLVDLVFGIDEQRQRNLTGKGQARVNMVCQRCLEPVAIEIECHFSLGIVWDEDEAKALPKSWDPWIADEGISDLYQVIEDELLLTLPMMAYHDEDCVPQALFSSGEELPEDDSALTESSAKANPFQVLEQLKKSD